MATLKLPRLFSTVTLRQSRQYAAQNIVGPNDAPLEFVRLEFLASMDFSCAYRASARIDSSGMEKSFILKDYLDFPGSEALLQTEASSYVTAQSVQGSVIPTFYGLYCGDIPDGRRVSVLVFEDCGDPREVSLHDLPDRDRHRVAKQLAILHAAGIRHGDPENNVIWQRRRLGDAGDAYEDVPMFINLERADEHVCERRMPIVFGAWRPTNTKFNCPELHNLADELSIWTYRKVYFDGTYIPIMDINGPEDLVRRSTGSTPLDNDSRTETTWRFVKKRQAIIRMLERKRKASHRHDDRKDKAHSGSSSTSSESLQSRPRKPKSRRRDNRKADAHNGSSSTLSESSPPRPERVVVS